MTSDPHRPAAEVAEAFLAAIDAGDAGEVWAVFSGPARRFVIDRGVRRGLSPAASEAILEGTADRHFQEQFLADVLAGLRKDVERIRLKLVDVGEPIEATDGSMRLVLLERFDVPVGPPLPPLPVGSIVLVIEDATWKVDRLIPRPGG